jgi:hypothetical protein
VAAPPFYLTNPYNPATTPSYPTKHYNPATTPPFNPMNSYNPATVSLSNLVTKNPYNLAAIGSLLKVQNIEMPSNLAIIAEEQPAIIHVDGLET